MKQCFRCRAVYDDAEENCQVDGAPLLDYTKLVSPQGGQKLSGRHLITAAAVAVALSLALVIYFVLHQNRSAPAAKTGVEVQQAVDVPSPTPDAAVEVRQTSDDARPVAPEDRHGYLVIGFSARAREEAEAEADRRNRSGHHAHVRRSDEWSGLAPGWYVVVYDTYDSAAEAGRATGELKARGFDAYVKYSGPSKAGGAAAPDGKVGQAAEETASRAESPHDAAVRQYGADEAEALGEVEKVWDRHFTRCGDSYVSADSYDVLLQAKGVSFVPRGVTFVLRAGWGQAEAEKWDGVEWSGTIQARWSVWRRALRRGPNWVWGNWRESPQERSFQVTKVNSEWKVLDVLYDQKKVECSDVPL